MKHFHYRIQYSEGAVDELIDAKNRVSADKQFSKLHPDITPSVNEVSATEARKLKRAFKKK